MLEELEEGELSEEQKKLLRRLRRQLLDQYTEIDEKGKLVNVPSTDDELYEFISLAFAIDADTPLKIPRVAVLPGHKAPFDFIADLFFERVKNVLGFASRTAGKALAVDTPILTTSGWSTMGEIEVGDYVFGPDGKPTRVYTTSGVQENRNCFEVTFSTGETIVADEEHLWEVRRAREKENVVLDTKQMYEEQEEWDSTQNKNYKKLFWVERTKPLEFPEKSVDVNPYVLGVWLGDGCKSNNTFCSEDPEIPERVRLFTEVADCGLTNSTGSCRTYRIPNFRRDAYAYFGQTTEYREDGRRRPRRIEKYVPENYLYGSVEQRLELLKGLLDTDGYASGTKPAGEFSSTDKSLADAVFWLLRSFGEKPWLSDRGPGKLHGKEYKNVWRVGWSFLDTNPFALPRKRERVFFSKKGRDHAIVSIKPCETVPVKCIGVENERRLFLAGRSLIPTHNTWNTAILNFCDMFFKPGCEVAHGGAVKNQAKRCYKYFLDFLDKDWFKDFCERYREVTGREFIKKYTQEETIFDNGSLQEIIVATEKGLRSPHPHKMRLDEIDLIEWDVLQTGMSAVKSSEKEGRKIRGQHVFTSTRQNEAGSMQRLLDTADEKGVVIYEWNIWEVVEKCERRCENDPVYGTCPIYAYCQGRAHYSDGFYPIEDFIDKARVLDEETFEVEWENKRPHRNRLVYSMFDNTKHVLDQKGLYELTGSYVIDPTWQRVSGIDFGASPGHPFAYVKLAQVPTGEWIIFHDYKEEQRLLRDHARAIKESPFYKPNELAYSDWARQERLELQHHGVRTRKADKDVMSGIDYVRELLSGYPPHFKPQLYVMAHCKDTIEEFGMYQFRVGQDGKPIREEPLKIWDHLMDSVRYALYTYKTRGTGNRVRTYSVGGI